MIWPGGLKWRGLWRSLRASTARFCGNLERCWFVIDYRPAPLILRKKWSYLPLETEFAVTFLHLRLNCIFWFFFLSCPLKISASLLLCCLFSTSCVHGDSRGKMGAVTPHPLQTLPFGFLMPSRQRILGSDICLGPAGSFLVQFIMAEVIEAHSTQSRPLRWNECPSVLVLEGACQSCHVDSV